jgi:hypothetical protein
LKQHKRTVAWLPRINNKYTPDWLITKSCSVGMLLCVRRSVKMMAPSGVAAYVAGAANLIVRD